MNKKYLSDKVIELIKKLDYYEYIDTILKILKQQRCNFYFIGGSIRDAIIQLTTTEKFFSSNDIDIVLEEDKIDILLCMFTKTQVFKRGNVVIKRNPSFLNSSVIITSPKYRRIDISVVRKEKYEKFGALPKVSMGDINTDISRRDFTINSVALKYSYELEKYFFYDPYEGIKDIIDKKIRVLHKRSFLDDPTRIIRAIYLSAKLNFEIEQETSKLIHSAVRLNVINNVSQVRLANELTNILKKGRNLPKIVIMFKKYHISKFYNFVAEFVKTFAKYSNKLEIEKKYACILDNDEIFYIRLLFLLQQMDKKFLQHKSDLSVYKTQMIKLNIPRKDREAIYNGIKILNGETSVKQYPVWLKVYIKIFNKKIFVPLLTATDLIKLGVSKNQQLGNILTQIRKLQIKGKLTTRQQAKNFVLQLLRLNSKKGK